MGRLGQVGSELRPVEDRDAKPRGGAFRRVCGGLEVSGDPVNRGREYQERRNKREALTLVGGGQVEQSCRYAGPIQDVEYQFRHASQGLKPRVGFGW